MLTLNQSQVDSIALFCEACTELEREPFFVLQAPLPNFNASSDWKHVTFKLGDRMEFRAGLVPFRRLWAPPGSAHWETVANILLKASLPYKPTASAKLEVELIQREMNRVKVPHLITLPAAKVIDLWLNGALDTTTLERRRQWEAAVAEFGHAPLDYVFRSGVRWIGYHFQRLADGAARPALALAKSELNLVPSFQVGAVNTFKRKEELAGGIVVRREGSSDHARDESFEDRYRRLLAAYDNQSLGRILSRLEASPGELMRAVLWCGTFAELLESVDGRLEVTELSWQEAGKKRTEQCNGSAASADGIWSYGYEGNLVVTGPKVVPLLDAAMARLRQQMVVTR